MQAGKITKSRANDRFTIIPNEPLQRVDLSWKAKGLLCYLLSLPPDWELFKTELQNHSTDGRDSTSAGFDELVASGYIEAEEVRDDKGRFKGYSYLVHNEPITENPKSVKPKTVKPKAEKPPLINKHSTKETEYKQNIFYILSESTKIFQPNVDGRYIYEHKNFVCFKNSAGGVGCKILVPEKFIIDYANEFHKIQFEGVLRNDFTDTPIEKREQEFTEVAKKAFASYHTVTLDGFQHFVNIIRKIKRDIETDKNRQGWKRSSNTSKESGYVTGQTNHAEGWS